MSWGFNSSKCEKDKPIKSSFSTTRNKIVIPVVFLVFALTVVYYFVYHRTPNGEIYPHKPFDEVFDEVCADPKLPMPIYDGPESFFNYIMTPETEFCYSWIQFGGEKKPMRELNDTTCLDEVRKDKFICFNEEYKANEDPCLVYSFEKDEDDQFERDMHLFSCEVHAFDHQKTKVAEHVRRSEFWFEHKWDISEYPYDMSASETPDGVEKKRRSLDFITSLLNHRGKEIKFLKSDMEGREWILMKQIITHRNAADFRQLGIKVHLPVSVNKLEANQRNETLHSYFKILQSLSCAGYRYVLSRPVKYYRGGLKFPEVNKTLYPAYEMNFVKDLNI